MDDSRIDLAIYAQPKEPERERIPLKEGQLWYREHDCGGDGYSTVHYTRLWVRGGRLQELDVTCSESYSRSDPPSWEIERESTPLPYTCGNRDYAMGEGVYALTEEQFGNIWQQMMGDLRRWGEEVF